jgi:cell division protein FtsQ
MTDPRIQARRVTVARQEGRRRRYRLLVGLAGALLVTVGAVLLHSSVLGARHVRVTGAENISSSKVIAIAGLESAPPLIDLSAASIAQRVELLPWVLNAEVKIAWPSTVAIHLTERIPVAAVARPGRSGSYAICDVTGRVLETAPSRPGSLPIVVLGRSIVGQPGPPGSSLPMSARAELEVAAEMPESMVPEVRAIEESPSGVVLSLTDHLRAIIGAPSELGQKFVSLATVLARGDLSGIGSIDLRVAAAPVLLPARSGPIDAGNVGG